MIGYLWRLLSASAVTQFNKRTPPGYTSAPMEWEYFGSKHQMRMLGGFFGVQQDPSTLALAPGIGYAIARAKSGSGDKLMPVDKKEGKGKRGGKDLFSFLRRQ